MKDLNKLLKNVIMEFGKNELYEVPTIGWSEENMLSRFGEYQYWKNHIIVSNYLNTDDISDRAVESIIYHEYMHQLYRIHSEEFNACMKKIEGYDDYNEEVQKYFDKTDSWTKKYKHDLQLEYGHRTVFCRMPFDSKEFESYLDNIRYYNHMIIGILTNEISSKFCKQPIEQVIWTVNYEGQEYIVGWAKDVQLYSSIRFIDLEQYDLGKCEYQYKYLQKNGKWLLSCNLIKCLEKYEIPKGLLKNGICDSKELDKTIYNEIIGLINSYASDFTELGISDNAIYDIPPLETQNVDLLMDMAKEELYSHRCVWIMNRVLELEQSVDTYYWYGRALESMCLFDEALHAYVKAREFDASNNDVNCSIKIVNAAIDSIERMI